MPAIFAQPTPDENLQPAWTVQGTGPSQGTTGVPGQGYSQAAPVPASVAAVGQTSAGFPYPPLAEDVGSENATNTTQLLVNGSYSMNTTTSLSQSATSPNVTTTGVQQPYGVNTTAAVVCGTGVTGISVAPFTTGTPAYVAAWTGTLTASQTIQVSVPPAGFIKTTGAAATSVTYTPTN